MIVLIEEFHKNSSAFSNISFNDFLDQKLVHVIDYLILVFKKESKTINLIYGLIESKEEKKICFTTWFWIKFFSEV